MPENRPIDLARQRVMRDVGRQILLDVGVTPPPAAVSRASDRIRAVVDAEVASERERCVRLCRERAELWRTASRGHAASLDESRGRANEAAYLADLLETPPGGPPPPSKGSAR